MSKVCGVTKRRWWLECSKKNVKIKCLWHHYKDHRSKIAHCLRKEGCIKIELLRWRLEDSTKVIINQLVVCTGGLPTNENSLNTVPTVCFCVFSLIFMLNFRLRPGSYREKENTTALGPLHVLWQVSSWL